jgi:uncharacterized protein
MRATVPLLFAGLGGALGAAECERAPPEDFVSHTAAPALVAPTAATVASASAPARSAAPPGRCVLATPAQPPPPVAPGPAAGCPSDPERRDGMAGSPLWARAVFPEAAGVAVTAEVVRSPHDTTRGLMYRTSLEEGRGMLFDLGEHEDHKFWMHNTCIPLDLLYVDQDGLIVGIVENAPTLDDDARGVGCASSYVLEVNAGWARRHGVKAGQHMTIPPEVQAR